MGPTGLRTTDLDKQKSNWDTGKAYLLSTVRSGIKMDHWE